MINVQVKSGGRVLDQLHGFLRGFPKKVRLAYLNAERYMKSELKKEIIAQTTQKYYLTKGQVKEAWYDQPLGFKIKSGMLTLDKYKLIPKSPRKKYVLRGAVKKSSSIAPLGRNTFLLRASRILPAARLTKRRYPLKILTGPSIPQAVQQTLRGEWTEGSLTEKAEQLFVKRINEYLGGAGMIKL